MHFRGCFRLTMTANKEIAVDHAEHQNRPEHSSLLGYREVASLLGVPAPTLRRWVAEQRIPHLRLGPRTVRFRLVELKAWLAQHEVASATPGETDAA